MKRICRVLVLTVGLVSIHAARAEMISVQGALQEKELARLDPELQPAGGNAVAVFILMFIALFALAVTPDRPDPDAK